MDTFSRYQTETAPRHLKVWLGAAALAVIAGISLYLYIAAPIVPRQEQNTASSTSPIITTTPATFSIGGLDLVSQQQIDRNTYEYTYQAVLTNNSDTRYDGAKAVITGTSPNVIATVPDLLFLTLNPHSSLRSTDTFTIRQNRAMSGPMSLQWTVTPTTSTEPAEKTYTDPVTGLSFTYPTFGRPTQIVARTNGFGGRTYVIQYLSSAAPAEGHLTFVPTIFIEANPDAGSLSLEDWFRKNVDSPSGELLASSAFSRKTLGNGMEVLLLTGTVPSIDYDTGPLSPLYGTAPNRSELVQMHTGQDTELATLVPGYSESDTVLMGILTNIAASMQFVR